MNQQDKPKRGRLDRVARWLIAHRQPLVIRKFYGKPLSAAERIKLRVVEKAIDVVEIAEMETSLHWWRSRVFIWLLQAAGRVNPYKGDNNR